MGRYRSLSRGIGWIVLAMTIEVGLMLPASHQIKTAAAVDTQELRCLALTLYWEARAEKRDALEAVAWVVLNRRNNPDFPDTICAVVREGGEDPPCQFSYWCDGEGETPKNEEAWQRTKKIATDMLESPSPDPTGGALFFHSSDIGPPWTKERKRTVKIGHHIFYR